VRDAGEGRISQDHGHRVSPADPLQPFELPLLLCSGQAARVPRSVQAVAERQLKGTGVSELKAGLQEFGGKMLGLVGVSGGAMGAVNALNSLRAVGRSLHAWVIPQQVAIPQGWKVFNQDGELQDEEYHERLLDIGRQVARFAFLHSSQEVKEFLELWEQAPPNPGG